ncbi:hypothetical protein ACX1N5_09540 [Acinetobacter sp. ANC 4636]
MISGTARAFALVGGSIFGLPSKLTGVAAAMLQIGGLAKWLTGVTAALGVGYGIGTGIREAYMHTETGQKFDGWLGETIAKRLAAFGYGPAVDAVAANEKYGKAAPVATRHSQPIQVHTTINLDTKPIAQAVTKYQTNGVMRLPASTGVNPYLTMPFPSSF